MTPRNRPSPIFGEFFKAPETLQDRTTIAAKEIIAAEKASILDKTNRLKAARLERMAQSAPAGGTKPVRKKD